MTKKILILTMASKRKKYCVAGIDIDTNEFIRLVDNKYPESNGLALHQMMDEHGQFAQILDLVTVSNIVPAPTDIQPENYTICFETKFKIEVKFSPRLMSKIIQRCPVFPANAILGNKTHRVPLKDKDKITHSLEVLYVNKLRTYVNEEGKFKADFIFHNVAYSKFGVSDPEVFSGPLSAEWAYIVVSIPDMENKDKNMDAYYKCVAKIFIVD